MASSTVDLWRSWQQERSGAAFESLVRPVLPALFDAARRSGLRAADAEDVVQDALTELARESGERPGHVGVAPWLIRSVRLKSKMRLRSESRRRRRERAVAGPEIRSEDGGERSVSQEVERALAELPDADRQILLLRFLYDLEYPEVAHVLGTSVNACRIRVHRAVRRLRARLGPQAGALIAALPLAPVPTAAGLVGAVVHAAGPATAMTAASGFLVGTKAICVVLVVAGLLLGGWFLASELGSEAETPQASEGEGRDAARVEATTVPREDVGRAGDPARLHGALDAQEPGAAAPGAERRRLPPYVVGRVRRADGRAAAGVEVRVLALGLDEPAARTDAEGRYRIPVGPLEGPHPTRALVVARDGDTAGRTPVYVSAGRRDELPARTLIVLGATYELDVVVRREGEPAPGARVVLGAIQEHGWSGMEESRADDAGRARFAGLPAGGYVVAASTGPDRALRAVSFPPDAGAICSLDLRSGKRTLEVTVLDGPTGEPIAGAEIELHEIARGFGVGWRYEPQPDIEPTDAAGRVVITGLDAAARLQVGARAPGHAPSGLSSGHDRGSRQQHARPLEPSAPGVVLRLGRPIRVSWAIEDGEVKVPPAGTAVVLRSDYGDLADDDLPAARIEGGRLHARVCSDAGFQAVAFLPDGAHARVHLDATGTPTRAIRFLRHRSCVVTLRGPDGAPAAGHRVQIGEFSPVFGPHVAGADGVVTVDGLPNEPLGLYVLPPVEEAEPFANLRMITPVQVGMPGRGPVRLDVVVPVAREVLLRLRLDDRPHLPPDLNVSCGGLRLLWHRDGAEAGAVRFLVRPLEAGEAAHVSCFATEFGGFSFVVPADGEDSPDPIEHTVELQRAGEVWLRTAPPPDGQMEIELQRLDPRNSTWVRGGWPWWLEGDAGQSRRWAGLRGGTHRFVDVKSGLATELFAVLPGASAAVVTLDLSTIVLLDGRVEVPPGYDPTRSRLDIEGRIPSAVRGRSQRARYGPRVRPDGTFQLRVVPGRVETLRIEHPELEPEPGSGPTRISGRTASVTLRLIARRLTRFRLHPEAIPALTPNQLALPPSIRLYAGPLDEEPSYEQELVLVDGAARFGGFAAGTYTVWIDIPPFAPRVLRKLALGGRVTDLGEVRLDEGLAVRVRVKPHQGGAVGLLNLQAEAVEGPAYTRGILERKEHEITLRGLRPGKHRVQLFEGVQVLLDEIIEIEAPDGALRELDLQDR